jgi:hypothetical protein
MVNVVTKQVFEAEDGSIFDSKEKAEQHEKELKSLKYFLVTWGADLTEGRSCLGNRSYIAVNANASHRDFAVILCHSKFGSPFQFCQGVFGSNAIMPYWRLSDDPTVKLDESIKIDFAVEERFASKKIYGVGLWDLSSSEKKSIAAR